MSDRGKYYIEDGVIKGPLDKSVIPQGVTQIYDTVEEASQALNPPASRNTGWLYSDRMVADYVYYNRDNGKVYFLYDISSLTGEETFISYEATGLKPGDYSTYWDADSLGNERVGPALQTVLPAGEIITSEGVVGPKLTMQNFTVARTAQGINLGNYIGETMESLEEMYPFIFDEVEGRLPALGLIFNSITSGKEITADQLTAAGVGKGFTKLKLDYLNATIASIEGESHFYNKIDENGNKVKTLNQAYVALENTVSSAIDRALGNIGINADVFKQDNVELYQQILSALVMGDVEYDSTTGDTTDFEKYLGYRLGIDGYNIDKESILHDTYKKIDTIVDNPGQFNAFIDFDSFKLSNTAISELKRIIGPGKYNALDEAEKQRLIGLYARDTNAAMQEYQKIFDGDPLFERYANKGLNYSLIVGNYRNNYSTILGDAADETSNIFMDSLNMSYEDAKKSYMEYGYKTGNKKYMKDLANSISQSLGGVVIR
jgi:hypothetical protein